MIIRALDQNGDWTFGKSRSDYLGGNVAIAQLIQTRVSSFLGDCFFDLGAGIDWFGFLGGSHDQLALNLAISATIINTENVTGILQVSSNLDAVRRSFTVSYKATTVYSVITGIFAYDIGS